MFFNASVIMSETLRLTSCTTIFSLKQYNVLPFPYIVYILNTSHTCYTRTDSKSFYYTMNFPKLIEVHYSL